MLNIQNILKSLLLFTCLTSVLHLRLDFSGAAGSGTHERSVLLVWCEPLDTSFSSSSAPAGCSATSPFFPPLLGSAGKRRRARPSLHPYHLFREWTLSFLWDLGLPKLHHHHHHHCDVIVFITILFVIIVIWAGTQVSLITSDVNATLWIYS